MLWQPRSIRQLVLLGFLLVVAPLGVAVLLTVQSLHGQALDNADLTQRTVTLTRATAQMQRDLLDLERRSYQYATLQDDDLLRLVRVGFDDLEDSLGTIITHLSGTAAVPAIRLRTLLRQLQQTLLAAKRDPLRLADALAQFDGISQQVRVTEQHSRARVDEEQEQQLTRSTEHSRWLLLMALGLALTTLLVALFFSYWISRPVKQVERVIRQLGGARSQDEIRINGPREMQLLGRQLSWLRDHLIELDEQKQQFLRHISHELKTPLASLREGADLLAEGIVGPDLNPGQREIVGIIQANSQELQRLIENLLDYNQLLSQEDILPQRVKLPQLLEEIFSGHRLPLKRQRLLIKTAMTVPEWELDVSKTRAALDNLISNAISYAESGTSIQVSSYVRKGVLVLDVANCGHPIEEDEAERIFEPFFQGRASRQGAIKGSGIGLSVARECIQAQGGSLRLATCKGFDVCLRITLPPMGAL